MTEQDKCPKCESGRVNFITTELLNPYIVKPKDWAPVWKWEWVFVGEDYVSIHYCPFCGIKLPTHQEMLLKELGY